MVTEGVGFIIHSIAATYFIVDSLVRRHFLWYTQLAFFWNWTHYPLKLNRFEFKEWLAVPLKANLHDAICSNDL